jgi:hypothetical protein
MRKLLLVFVVGLFGCNDLENAPEPQRIKIACLCKDGTIIVQNENLLKQTSNLTGESCLNNGGLLKYIYK